MNRPFASPSTDSSHHNMQSNSITQNSHVMINQQITLTKNQFELLKIISKAHDKSISEYIQIAVVETMKTEIEFGDFCDILLDKLDTERE
jgi:hypothetical protein